MTYRVTIGIAAAAILAASFLAPSSVSAQGKVAVPDHSVKRGYGPDADQASLGGAPPPEVIESNKKAPTPHTADGHPDLTGFWGTAGWGYAVTYGKLSADGKTYDIDNPVGAAERPSAVARAKEAAARGPVNPPPYKPELAAKVKDMTDHFMIHDPDFYCGNPGFPRLGAPTEIAQTPSELIFIYDPSEYPNIVRIIPIDGRGHNTTVNPSFLGDSVGHWEGDKMVIDVNNFVDETWLARNAPLHSDDLHVVETLKREGNVLQWGATIEDPQVFTKPWVLSRTIIVGLKGGHVLEELPCHEQDAAHIPGK